MGLYIILMGVQGAGKGEQSKFLQAKYNIPQISTGDLFRALKGRTDELAMQIDSIMKQGGLVPDDITAKLVEERLAQPDVANGAIFDGFPRNTWQAEWLDKHLASKGQSITAAILLELELYVAFKRAFGRVDNPTTKKTYNIFYNNDGIEWKFVDSGDGFPPRLEAVEKASGQVLNRRADDANAGAIVKRIDKYIEETFPVADYYKGKGLLQEVDATKSISDVSKDIEKIIESRKVTS
jgi:adenylate kinase